MKIKVSQKKQLTMFCSLTVAYSSMLVGILRFGLEIADVIFMDTVFNYETCTRLVIYTCIILSAISIVCFLKNVDKGFVFDKKNIYPLRFFAWTVTLTGIILTVINSINDSDSQTYMFYILIGIFINILSEVFNLGVKMKEEQDLTI